MESIIRVLIYISLFIGLFTLVYYLLGFYSKKKEDTVLIKEPMVSIIIPAYNEEKTLAKTVDSVLGLNYSMKKLEIIIVNDGSKDNTLKIAKEYATKHKNIIVIDKENGGKATAMNLGIKVAKGEYVISFDADSMVTKDALKYALPYFSDPKVMCVTPSMKVYNPKGIYQRVQAIEYDQGIFLRKAFSNINAIHVTPGPFSIYKKEFFDKYGGYDELNITEDMEIAMRIQSLNYRIENSPKSLVYTVAPNTFYGLLRQRRRWYFGMIKNLMMYKYMFGKKYGELGIFIFPLAIISTFMIMFITTYYIFKSIAENIKELTLYSTIGFDYATNISFRWYSIYLSFYRFISENIILFGGFFLIISISILLITNKKVGGDKPIRTFISYIFFMFFYSVLFTFWWGISIIYALTHKEIKW